MLLDSARKTYSRIIVLFIATLVLLWLKQILIGDTITVYNDNAAMPLSNLLKSLVSSPLWESVYVIIITVVSSSLLMVIVRKHDLLRDKDYLAALIFILFSLSLPSQKQVCGAHLAALFCILSFDRLLLIYNRTGKSGNIYLATFYIGIAGLFYSPALLYLPIFLLGIALLKVFNWRDFFLSIFGTATPFIFAISYFHLVDKDIIQPFNTLISYFTPGTPFFMEKLEMSNFNIGYIYLGYIALMIIIATISNVRSISANIKTSRVLGILRITVGILLAAIIFFPAMQSPYMLTLIAVSASILMTSYFSGIRRVKVANVLLILLIISCLALQFYF